VKEDCKHVWWYIAMGIIVVGGRKYG